MTNTAEQAKARLDLIIKKARVDLYKPIHIAEVLHRARLDSTINTNDLTTFQNPSLRWRNEVTQRLVGKSATSSARYQHDVWNPTAMPPPLLNLLDTQNNETGGAVERYIYLRYAERQGTVTEIIAAIEGATTETFDLRALLNLFVTHPGIKRSVDKAYEIVTHTLLETVIVALGAKIKVRVPQENHELLSHFSDLARVLLGLAEGETEWEQDAHLYRVGVTNAADRGLDMWANFGPVVQVKHLTLDPNRASQIVDQVESDCIVIVCRDADKPVIETIAAQIGWGRRVRGIVTESNLMDWYERCLRGAFASQLAGPLLARLVSGFKAEFPQTTGITEFMEERGYLAMTLPPLWQTEADTLLSSK